MAHPTKAIKDLCSFSSGHGFTRHDWAKAGLPIIRIAHLNGSRRFDYYPGEPDPEWVVEPGELLFAWAGTKGVSFGPTIWNGPRGVLNQHIFRVRPKNGVDQTWLYYALLQVTRRIEKRAHGFKSTLLHVRKSDIEDQRWPVPPPADQRRSVEVLSLAERVVVGLDDLIQANSTFKRGLMQQMLTGQTRFPEFKDRPWSEARLGEVFDERNESSRSDLPLLSVTNDRGIIPRNELDKRDTSNPDKGKYKRVAIGDIAYNTMRMWQGASALSSLDGIVSPAYTVLIPTTRIYGPFAKHLFKFPPMVHLFHRHSQGLVDDTLNLKFDRFAKIKVQIPSDTEEQERIANVLDLCEAEIGLLVALRTQFENRKRVLLSSLLSGAISVRAS